MTTATMKAVVADRYGGPEVLEMREVATPAVGPGDVLVAVRATTLQPLDWHYVRGKPHFMRLESGLRTPKRTIHGADVAGVVAAVGAEVDDLAPGEEVFGWCDGGALAELVAVPRDHLERVPEGVSLDHAATIGVAAFTALQSVRDHGRVAAGDRVLVVGASSGVGHFAVQLSKAAGAHVTGVCSTRNLEMARGVGADDVIDRTTTDWAAGDERWDVIIQVAGDVPYATGRRVLAPGGRYVVAGGNWTRLATVFFRLLVRSRFDRRLVVCRADENATDLRVLRDMLETGTLRPVIDRRFPLADAAEALRYVEEGRASGKVVVTI